MTDVYRAAAVVGVIDVPVYNYVANPESVTRNVDITVVQGVSDLLIKLYGLCLKNPELLSLYRQTAVREVLTLMRNCSTMHLPELVKPLTEMITSPCFCYLMEGFGQHRYSRSKMSEIKNRLTIRLLLSKNVPAAVLFTKAVYGVH